MSIAVAMMRNVKLSFMLPPFELLGGRCFVSAQFQSHDNDEALPSKARGRRTTVRRRESRSRDSRKAAFGLRLRAGLTASNRVRSFPRAPYLELVISQRAESNRD